MKKNNETVLYGIYDGDEWLSSDSLVCMGVFDKDHLEEGCTELVKDRVEDNFDYETEGVTADNIREYCDREGIDYGVNESDEEIYNRVIEDFVANQVHYLMEHRQTVDGIYRFVIKEIYLNEYEEI